MLAAARRIPGSLPSLLARFAANIFWMARYLERAESLARILAINETYARGNPEGRDWRLVLLFSGHGVDTRTGGAGRDGRDSRICR